MSNATTLACWSVSDAGVTEPRGCESKWARLLRSTTVEGVLVLATTDIGETENPTAR